MRIQKFSRRVKVIAVACTLGVALQFSGCDLGMITTTTTVDGRQALIDLLRGAILTPIDAAITEAINNAFGDDEE